MGKKGYTEHLNLRLNTVQREFLDELSALHGVKPSDTVRGLIEYARIHHVVDSAIETIDRIAGPAKEARDAATVG